MKNTRIISILIIALFVQSFAFGQIFPSKQDFREPGTPFYYARAVRIPTNEPDSTKVLLNIKVPYDGLQFVKQDSLFQARYEISIVVFDNDGIQADGEIKQYTVRVAKFETTNAQDQFDYSKFTFNLHNALYKVSIGLMDMDTRKTTYWKNDVDLRDYSKSGMQVSDIIIADSLYGAPGTESQFFPNVNRRLDDKNKNYYAVFTLRGEPGQAMVITSVLNNENKPIKKESHTVILDDSVSSQMIKMNLENLDYSQYKYRITFVENGKTTSRDTEFRVSWVGLSGYVANLDKAIEQMAYILSSGELNRMKNAPPDKKKEMFTNYWKEKDPTPDTPENELMNEYFRRINYANENFGSSIKDGWRTDMGMVYALFGAPNDVERHPFDIGSKPYQIWYYFEINRQFVFVDDTGFGEYRLITPLYEYYNSSF